MTLKDTLERVKESEISKLVFENSVLGLRVKSYNINENKFDYYDFELSIISDQNVINFIKSIKNMSSITLVRTNNGLLMSQAEITNGVVVREFENETDAIKVLRPFIRIYKYKSREVQ